jgi:hypothetical protein
MTIDPLILPSLGAAILIGLIGLWASWGLRKDSKKSNHANR